MFGTYTYMQGTRLPPGCGLTLSLIIAAAIVAPKFGAFDVAKTPNGIKVARGSHSVLLEIYPLSSPPSVAGNGDVIAIGGAEHLSLIDANCRVLWAVNDLDYITSPGSVVVGSSAVAYYNGPFHLSQWIYRTKKQWVEASRRQCFVEARSYRGDLLWRKPWLDLGLPRASHPTGFLMVRPSVPEAGESGVVLRTITAAGAIKRTWYFDDRAIGRGRTLGEYLCSEDVIWAPIKSSPGVKYRLSEVRSALDLDFRKAQQGFSAVVENRDGLLSLKILGPKQMSLRGRLAH